MMETKTCHSPMSMVVHGLSNDRLELSRLLVAAVVNPRFCNQLLEEPELAIANGFQGETFSVTDEERDLVKSIRADSLSSLAEQLVRTFSEPISLNRTAQVTSPVLGY